MSSANIAHRRILEDDDDAPVVAPAPVVVPAPAPLKPVRKGRPGLSPNIEGFLCWHPTYGWKAHYSPPSTRPGIKWDRERKKILITDPAWLVFEDRTFYNGVLYVPSAEQLVAHWASKNIAPLPEQLIRIALIALGYSGADLPGTGFEPSLDLIESDWVSVPATIRFHPCVKQVWEVSQSHEHYKREGVFEGGGVVDQFVLTEETEERPWPANYRQGTYAERVIRTTPKWAEGCVEADGVAQIPWSGVQFRHRVTGQVDAPAWTAARFTKHSEGIERSYPYMKHNAAIAQGEVPSMDSWQFLNDVQALDFARVKSEDRRWGAVWRKEDGTIRTAEDDSVEEAIRDAQIEYQRLVGARIRDSVCIRALELLAESLEETEETEVLPNRVRIFKDMLDCFQLRQ